MKLFIAANTFIAQISLGNRIDMFLLCKRVNLLSRSQQVYVHLRPMCTSRSTIYKPNGHMYSPVCNHKRERWSESLSPL